jgi:hypothetical protein
MLLLMTKQDILKAFIENKNADDNVLAVIVFGSYARGNSRPDSDIDLVIILKNGFKRVAEEFQGQTFEIIYTTEESALDYWNSNKHDAFGLWSVAQIAFDRDGTGKRLKEYGENLCKELPEPLDESTLGHLRFDAQDSIKAAEIISETDIATASLLIHKKVIDLIDLFFDKNQKWHPAPKQQLETIESINKTSGALFTDFYSISDFQGKVEVLKKIAKDVLG